jgi:Domain of unknown function (DUF6894)
MRQYCQNIEFRFSFSFPIDSERPMPRYYFNIRDGHTEIDTEGTELTGLQEARTSALRLAGALLAEGSGATLWDGPPWTLWVTDAPHPSGATLFSLSLSAGKGRSADYPTGRTKAARKEPCLGE